MGFKYNYSFKPELGSWLLLPLIPLFIALGFWQLHRADERKLLQSQRDERLHGPPLDPQDALTGFADLRYRPIRLRGTFDTRHQIFLDNQVHAGVAGYFVYTPLRVEASDMAVLVNRGWVAVGSDRAKLPDISVSEISRTVVGIIDRLPRPGLELAGAAQLSGHWPSVVQLLDGDSLSTALAYRIQPYQVLLNPEDTDGYVREWRLAAASPEQNLGYALQWFSFATIATIAFVRVSFVSGANA